MSWQLLAVGGAALGVAYYLAQNPPWWWWVRGNDEGTHISKSSKHYPNQGNQGYGSSQKESNAPNVIRTQVEDVTRRRRSNIIISRRSVREARKTLTPSKT